MIVGNGRVVSGMRPTGRLHLGHLHGVLKNWAALQQKHECFFFVADWHALTTHYEVGPTVFSNTEEMVVDWLACGINPGTASIFVQSQIPEHAELHLLLSMVTPLSWLERVPSYKDQQQKASGKELNTYGFLGYPLLQSADILIYRANLVPIGEDQVAHIELARELARRFNHLFGQEEDFEARVEAAIDHMGKKNGAMYRKLRKRYQEQGDEEARKVALALCDSAQNISLGDQERLTGYLEGSGKMLLPEPEALLTPSPKLPGTNGQKMSKSSNNTITLRETDKLIEKKLNRMPTDPARQRRTDPGTPEKCPVWEYHRIYSDESCRAWVQKGCRSASIGCLECKRPIIDAVIKELRPIRKLAGNYDKDRSTVRKIIAEGNENARDEARDTLLELRRAVGLPVG